MELFRRRIAAGPTHTGRGGWTWYTGSSGWMYRLATETLLGIHLETDRLRIEPLLPDGWEGFAIHYRYRDTFCHIKVRRAGGGPGRVGKVVVDDAEQPDLRVPLVDDRREHNVEIQVLPAAG